MYNNLKYLIILFALTDISYSGLTAASTQTFNTTTFNTTTTNTPTANTNTLNTQSTTTYIPDITTSARAPALSQTNLAPVVQQAVIESQPTNDNNASAPDKDLLKTNASATTARPVESN